ncbi:hypothetical protein RvY_19337, partial [Ramazzottius varieornatus]
VACQGDQRWNENPYDLQEMIIIYM